MISLNLLQEKAVVEHSPDESTAGTERRGAEGFPSTQVKWSCSTCLPQLLLPQSPGEPAYPLAWSYLRHEKALLWNKAGGIYLRVCRGVPDNCGDKIPWAHGKNRKKQMTRCQPFLLRKLDLSFPKLGKGHLKRQVWSARL